MNGSLIETIEVYLPKKTLTNSQLSEMFPEWDASKIESKVGIVSRHIADHDESALDMAIAVSEKMLESRNRNEIDFVLYCTQSPEFFLPSGACILQDKLRLRKDIGAFDINLGCSGYVYGLSIADSLIKSGHATSILFVTSETYSKHIDPSDKGNLSIFGDAATATLIRNSSCPQIHHFVFGTDGAGYNKLIVKKGAFPGNCTNSYFEESSFPDNFLYMNGPDIFSFTMDVVPDIVNRCLVKNTLSKSDVGYFVFHQANKYILDFLRKSIGIPQDKFYINLTETGNTVSSTIPIALYQMKKDGLIKKGDKLLLVGFGVGLSWAATVVTL